MSDNQALVTIVETLVVGAITITFILIFRDQIKSWFKDDE